jgi:single-stranded DNA-specific DHH superfamily exonuclease
MGMEQPELAPTPVHYGQELDEARHRFDAFISKLDLARPAAILCDGDVDGLGAGVVLWHYVTRGGVDPANITVLQPEKGENAFTPTTRGYVARSHPRSLFVLDLGVSERRIVHEISTLFVDHHRPTGEPEDATVITGYTWRPVPTSSLLTYLLCNADGKMADKAWAAAIGNMGDLGPDYQELHEAAKAQKLKWVREAIAVLNAAKRSSRYPLAIAFEVLRDAGSAQEIAEGNSPGILLLKQCRAEVKAALDEAKRLAPKFSKTEKVALFELNDPNRIQPLLAQSWHGRLPKFIVICANHGFLPGRVAFSARTSSGMNILDLLARHRQAVPDELEYGYGHDQAAGGVVSEEGWRKLKVAMGF